MPRIRKAVLPVAGLGTRVLPATKVTPKEMLPVFDRPALQYVIDEALAAKAPEIDRQIEQQGSDLLTERAGR